MSYKPLLTTCINSTKSHVKHFPYLCSFYIVMQVIFAILILNICDHFCWTHFHFFFNFFLMMSSILSPSFKLGKWLGTLIYNQTKVLFFLCISWLNLKCKHVLKFKLIFIQIIIFHFWLILKCFAFLPLKILKLDP